jgi:hypothetical protein
MMVVVVVMCRDSHHDSENVQSQLMQSLDIILMKSCSCKQRALWQLTQTFDGERNVGNTITSRQESRVGEVWLLFVALIYGTMM